MGELDGQVALVTGGGRGIGRAIAQALAAAGAVVAVTARTATQVEETVAQIGAAGGRAVALPGDSTDPPTVTRLLHAVETHLGSPDVLVNNAAVLGPGGVEAEATAWWAAMTSNLFAPFLWMQAVLPRMTDRGHGRIINVAAAGGVLPPRNSSAYFVSKAALIRLTEGVATEFGARGIVAFAIHPGGVWTEMAKEIFTRRPDVWPGGLENPARYLPNSPAEPAQLCVALAAGRADALSGRYLEVGDDLEALIGRADEIRAGDLQTLRLRT